MLDEERLQRFKSLDFYARQVVEGFITGRHRSPFHGFSAEFADYRQYNTGESTRHIDWHLYGRTDKLFVKRFQEETNLRCRLVVDHSSSMLFPLERHASFDRPNKLTFSVYAAAVLSMLMLRQRDAFGLTLVSSGIDLDTPCRSSVGHQRHLLGLLADCLAPLGSPSGLAPRTTALPEALHLIAEQQHRRSMVVLFTDALVSPSMREPLFDALRHLRHNRHEVILFHTLDADLEQHLRFEAKPTEFIDLESGRHLRLNPADHHAAYEQRTTAQVSELRHRALQYRIDYQPVDIALGFDPIILPFLLRRSKVG